MVKEIEYYLNLPYKIEIEGIPEKEGGGFLARLPQFGELGIVGDGDTKEEALKNLEETKKARFARYLKEDISIPEPYEEMPIDEYSGKFVIRIPKYLHRTLVTEAKHNGVSLNQFITSFLAGELAMHTGSSAIKEIYNEIIYIKNYLYDIKHNLTLNFSLKLNKLPEYSDDECQYRQAA